MLTRSGSGPATTKTLTITLILTHTRAMNFPTNSNHPITIRIILLNLIDLTLNHTGFISAIIAQALLVLLSRRLY